MRCVECGRTLDPTKDCDRVGLQLQIGGKRPLCWDCYCDIKEMAHYEARDFVEPEPEEESDG